MLQLVIDTAVKYWTQELFVLVLGLIGFIWKQLKTMFKEMKALRGGVRGSLRIQIKAECKEHLANGYISISDREVLNEMFEEYFALGGNGPVKHLKQEIDTLPTRIDDDD